MEDCFGGPLSKSFLAGKSSCQNPMYLGAWLCAAPGAYPRTSSSCISIRPGFLCIEGGPLGGYGGYGLRCTPDPDAGAALSIGVISCQATVSEPRPRTWIQKVVNKVSVCRAGRRRIYTRCSPHFEGNSRSGRRDESLKRCYHVAGSQVGWSIATPRYSLRYLTKTLLVTVFGNPSIQRL